MRFKTFLESQWPHSKLEYGEMVEWIEHNALRFFKREQPIYRGIWDKAEGLYNGNQLERRAAHASFNYYNLWLSNHDDWKNFPKRSKSFICSTSEFKASEYGEAYYIIPQDSSHIGICPESDIWQSFPKIERLINIPDRNIAQAGQLSEVIDDMMTGVLGKKIKELDSDWDVFLGYAASIGLPDLESSCSDYWWYKDVSTYMVDNNLFSIDQMLEHVLSPQKFKLVKAESFTAIEDREVWMSGSVLIVTEETYDQLKRDLL